MTATAGRMRITFLLPHYGWFPSGGFSVVYTYANLLSARGHEVHVIHPRRLPAGGWHPPRGVVGRARRVARRVRDAMFRPSLSWARLNPAVHVHHVPRIADAYLPDADVVIATWWSTAEAALTLSDRKGRRFHLIQGYEIWHGAEARVHDVWRAPLHKIFIARWLQQKALEIGVDPAQTTLIPNAIDHRTFRVVAPIADRGPRVAMLHAPAPYKGAAIGLEILRSARTQVPELDAVLFGAGRAPRSLPSWITYVRSASPEQLRDDVYNRASIYLCPSLSEGWHLPPAEAMACGCAVVSSAIGGVADYAVDEETALLFEPGNVAAGTRKLVALLTDEPRRVALAERGRDRIGQFSWERSTDQLVDLLRSAMSGRAT